MFCEINADQQPNVLSQYGVSGLPTILFLTKDAKVAKTIVGGLPLATLLQAMDDAKAAAGG